VTERAGTETAAANSALAHIGEPGIAGLDAGTAAARWCRQEFGNVRDAVLAMHEWNFATAWARPAASPGEALGPLKIRYPLPPDCITVRFVDELGEDDWAVEVASVTDEIGATIETKLLVTNAEAPTVCYTRRVESVANWDPLFLKVFGFYLAARVAPGLGRDASLGRALEEEARAFLPMAKRRDSREKAPQATTRDTSWVRARRGWR
jgi:hypothetical protein